MKIDLFENKYSPSRFSKIIFMDIICFLLAISMAFSVCYSYFGDRVSAQGATALTSLTIEYRVDADDPSTSTNVVYGSINGVAYGFITAGTVINPGDTLYIGGYAVNTSNIDVYAMARLEVVTNKDRDVRWWPIANYGDEVTLMMNGMFSGGSCDIINAGDYLGLYNTYEFNGYKYTNQHIIQSITLTLHAHQKDYLTSASDYGDYAPFDLSGENMRGEVDETVYATHQIIGRKRSVWKAGDADVDGLGLNHLTRDSAGNYLINSCKDWMILAKNCNASNDYCNGMTFKLNAYLDFSYMNLELSAQTFNKTIDTFKGNLDGNGYTISRWFDTNGLIYNCYGNISNLGMESFVIVNVTEGAEDITLQAKQYVGSIVAVMHNGTISNCFATDQYVMGDEAEIGGGCISMYEGEGHAMGALVGLMRADSGKTATMRNCFAMSILIYAGADGAYLGGLVGKTEGAVSIDNSYFFGGVGIEDESQGHKVGLIANADANASINNSWAFFMPDIMMNLVDLLNVNIGCLSGTDCEINNCLLVVPEVDVLDQIVFFTIDTSEGQWFEDSFDGVCSYAISFLHNQLGWQFDDWHDFGLPYDMDFEAWDYFIIFHPTPRVFYDF